MKDKKKQKGFITKDAAIKKKQEERNRKKLSAQREIRMESDKLLDFHAGPRRSIREIYADFVDEKLRHILNWIFSLSATLAVAALTAIVFFQSVTMQESSMEPTLNIGDKSFVNRFIYRVSSPERGDIVVFRTNASDEAVLHVRRIIGLPGERIQIVKGTIYINGEAYRESKDFPSIVNSGIAENEIVLEDDEYFVLGDNRNNSEDSRYGEIGNIDAKYIVGELWYTISPVNKIGFLKG